MTDRAESIPLPPPRTNLYIPPSSCNMCVRAEPYDAVLGGVGTGDYTPNTTPIPTYSSAELSSSLSARVCAGPHAATMSQNECTAHVSAKAAKEVMDSGMRV